MWKAVDELFLFSGQPYITQLTFYTRKQIFYTTILLATRGIMFLSCLSNCMCLSRAILQPACCWLPVADNNPVADNKFFFWFGKDILTFELFLYCMLLLKWITIVMAINQQRYWCSTASVYGENVRIPDGRNVTSFVPVVRKQPLLMWNCKLF